MESWSRGLQNWKTVQMKGCAFAAEIPGLSRSGQPRPLPTSEIPGHAVAPSGVAGHCSEGWGLQREWRQCQEGIAYFRLVGKQVRPRRNACWKPLWTFDAQSEEWGTYSQKNLPPEVLKQRGNWRWDAQVSFSNANGRRPRANITIKGDGKAVSGRTWARQGRIRVWGKVRESTKNQPF